MKTYINPKILTWARERNQLTIENLARKLKRDSIEIKKWENGEKDPPLGCLEELAYKHFKIPFAVLFFPEPPKYPDPVKKFRRLPETELLRFSEDTLKKIRLAQAYQNSLYVILEGYTSKKIFKDISPHNLSLKDLIHKVRRYIGISIEKQFKFTSCENAFKQWRHALEECGVFTFKDSLKDRFISGFCLKDDNYPIIFINNSSAFSRQVFTIIHELGHILFGVDGITDIDDSYLSFLNKYERNMEIFCNNFASYFLVPDEGFDKAIEFYKKMGINHISELADRYSVSREVILRRLLERGVVSESLYREKADEWNQDYLRSQKGKKGGDYYLTQLSYLGEGFAKLAFERLHRGDLDKADLADHFNMKAKYLDSLEIRLRW